jgi:putative spermidine/putrescine transport system permease protein
MHEDPAPPGITSTVIAIAVAVFLLLPLVIVVPISFGHSSLMEFPPREFSLRWYRALWDNPRWLEAALTSIRLGLIVAACSTVLATLTAIGLSRYFGPGRALLQALVLSPLMGPVIVSGVALYYLFSMLKLTGTLTALVIAHTLLTFPYGVVVINSALERFDPQLEQAAMSLGADPLSTLLRVTLPIIKPFILVTAMFAFLISFDEVVMALLLSGPETATVPKQMWDGIRFDLSPTIASVSTILLVFSSALVALGEYLRRRSANLRDKANDA